MNVSSVAGRVAPAGFAAYAATKWGINGWSEALRVELQPDVRVIVIEPGATATELPDHITHAASKRVSKKALDWSIPPHDIADVIAFAVSRPQRVTLNEIPCVPRCRQCERRRGEGASTLGAARMNFRPGHVDLAINVSPC